jgi:hypothetical protein
MNIIMSSTKSNTTSVTELETVINTLVYEVYCLRYDLYNLTTRLENIAQVDNPEHRIGLDGFYYTNKEFVDWYGYDTGSRLWHNSWST